ncbi:MAG: carbohydrate ABC transporter permease [Tannerella sp.]|jgi:putative aldouronate transport system permease protein|nr:carbohydrate ABC transporter permease [Tannerella sp.]
MVKSSRSDYILRAVIIVVLCGAAFIALIPLLSVFSKSLSSRLAVEADKVTLLPVNFTLDSWAYMMEKGDIWRSFAVTVGATFIGTILALVLNVLTAYPLSKKEFPLSKALLFCVLIAMIFKAPLVPYFLTVRAVKLYDNPWVLVIPQLFSEFNLMIMITFMRQFPVELEEAAIVEGSGYFRRLFTIVLPLSKAPLATLGMFYAVILWNQFQHPLLFIQSPEWYPLQIKIRQLITSENALPLSGLINLNYNMTTLQSVAIVFAIIPILVMYPFLQKYFAKGAMVGSIKG